MSETLFEMAKRLCNENCASDSCPIHGALHGWDYNNCIVRLIAKGVTSAEQIVSLLEWAAENPPQDAQGRAAENVSESDCVHG